MALLRCGQVTSGSSPVGDSDPEKEVGHQLHLNLRIRAPPTFPSQPSRPFCPEALDLYPADFIPLDFCMIRVHNS